MGGLEEALGSDDSGEPTKTESEVLEVAERNPDMKQTEIADVVGCSDSTVSRALQKHDDPAGQGRGSGQDSDSDSGGIGLVGWLIIFTLLGVGVLAVADGGGESSSAMLGALLLWV